MAEGDPGRLSFPLLDKPAGALAHGRFSVVPNLCSQESQPVFIRVALCMSDGMEQAQIQLQAMITARKKNMPHRTPAVASRSKKRPSLWVASLWWFGRQGPLGFKGIGVEIPALNNGATAWCDVLARCRACLLLGDMFARPASSDYRLQFPRSNFLRGKRIGTNNEAMLGHSA